MREAFEYLDFANKLQIDDYIIPINLGYVNIIDDILQNIRKIAM